jgi:hypothetical protein
MVFKRAEGMKFKSIEIFISFQEQKGINRFDNNCDNTCGIVVIVIASIIPPKTCVT